MAENPNAVILSYPVITSGEYAHRGSFTALLGTDASEEELEYMSLEKQVTEAWVNEEVKQWPELADEWIRTTL